jgi:hypothetical protein
VWTAVSAIVSGLLKGAWSILTGWLQRREDRAQGAADQAGRETAATVATEARIAEAEADAPKTDQAIDDRLSKGTF